MPARALRAPPLAPFFLLCLLHHLRVAEPAPAALTPFSRVSSKAEAVAAFAGVEAALSAGPFAQKQVDALRALYFQWKSRFGVTYPADEDEHRFDIFKASVTQIIANNKDPAVSHWSGLNQFSATTWDEFKQGSLGRGAQSSGPTAAAAPVFLQSSAAAPDYVDWRATDQVTPVKNQNKCGACWVFASVAAMESAALIQSHRTFSNYPIDLSEEQLVNCVNMLTSANFRSSGCDGGWEWEPMTLAAKQFVTTEQLYPDTSSDSGNTSYCKNSLLKSIDPASKLKLADVGGRYPGLGGFYTVKPNNVESLKQAVAQKPVVVSFEVEQSFQLYQGGIYNGPDCMNDYWSLNHALLVVGYDSGAWLLKNSWGESFGEEGYVQVAMAGNGNGVCGMYQESIVPTKVEVFPVLGQLPLPPSPDAIKPMSLASKTCFQSGTAGAHLASAAVDGNITTYSKTKRGISPWWAINLGRQLVAVSSVSITLRTDKGFQTPCMSDVEVWVGDTRPSKKAPPSTILTKCASQDGRLSMKKGDTVTLKCKPGPIIGRYLAIQIRSLGDGGDVLSMSELQVNT